VITKIFANEFFNYRHNEDLKLEIFIDETTFIYDVGIHNVGLDNHIILRFLRYDTRGYFNVRSKADMSRFDLPHGNDN